ncbi:sugar phosphate isomerase/epimerase [Frigoribacterium sp. UYMn621]|uniref:sugar phosphate isomerase/epimerase family protein n=1 Tax=Frigoribacterium sp. UYMn621 TaxID=3156343 RepID=UPI003396EAE6
MTAVDESIVGSVLALCTQTPGARRGAGPMSWRSELRRLKRSGFSRVDLLDNWLPFAHLTASEVDDLGSILVDIGLTAPCLGTSRRSLIDPELGEENLEYTLKILEVAHRLGLRRVGVGFHPALVDAQRQSAQFWEHAGRADDRTDENWDLAARRVAVVCDAAAELEIDLNIELYEDSLMCTSEDVARLMAAVDRPNFGVNPDLGNLVRSVTPLRESWLDTLRGCLPHMTYWHLKNYTRSTLAPGGPFAVAPTALGDGTIDYRLAVTEALAAGYSGPMVVEHYGGDALWMQERSAEYLRRLVDELRNDEREEQ